MRDFSRVRSPVGALFWELVPTVWLWHMAQNLHRPDSDNRHLLSFLRNKEAPFLFFFFPRWFWCNLHLFSETLLPHCSGHVHIYVLASSPLREWPFKAKWCQIQREIKAREKKKWVRRSDWMFSLMPLQAGFETLTHLRYSKMGLCSVYESKRLSQDVNKKNKTPLTHDQCVMWRSSSVPSDCFQ